MKIQKLLTLLALTTAGMISTAAADTIVLNNGERLVGRVEDVRGEKDRVALIRASGRIVLNRSNVKSIEETDDATDYTALGDEFFQKGAFDTAVQMYQQALASDANHAAAKEGMDKAMARINDQKAEAERKQVSSNSDSLQEIRQIIDTNDIDKFAGAEKTLDGLEMTNATEEQKASAQLLRRDLYLAWGLGRLDRLDPIGAEDYLQKVLDLDPGNEKANDAILTVWERDSSKRPQVLAAYQRKLEAAPEDLVLNQKVADLLIQLQRPEEAIPMLTRLADSAKYRNLGYDKKLFDALEAASYARAGNGDLDGAIALYNQLLTTFPSADPSPLAYLNYEKRLSTLAPEDWQGRAALLKDLERDGLHAMALQEADFILRNDSQNAVALDFLKKDAEARIADINMAFSAGQYIEARDMSRQFLDNNNRFPDLVQAAGDLYAKADLEVQRQAKQLREQAKEIVARGDEYLSTAQRNAELMKNEESSDRTTVVSFKQEAIKYSKRAIDTYQIALRTDPSLGPITGMDVNSKLSDAQSLYNSLTAAPTRLRSMQQRGRVPNNSGNN